MSRFRRKNAAFLLKRFKNPAFPETKSDKAAADTQVSYWNEIWPLWVFDLCRLCARQVLFL